METRRDFDSDNPTTICFPPADVQLHGEMSNCPKLANRNLHPISIQCHSIQCPSNVQFQCPSNVTPSNVHPDYPRCGDLSEVDKPSTWELGPRILQVSPSRFQIHLLYSVTKQDTFEIVSKPISLSPNCKNSQEIKDISFDGLTGRISFDEQGRRRNFTMDVLEMTVSIFVTKSLPVSLSIFINDVTGWK